MKNQRSKIITTIAEYKKAKMDKGVNKLDCDNLIDENSYKVTDDSRLRDNSIRTSIQKIITK